MALAVMLVSEHLFATPVNYSVSNGFQDAWTGVLDVSNIALPIGITPTVSPSVSAITAVSGTTNLSFVPTSYTLSGTSDLSSPIVAWGGNAGKAFFKIYSTDFYNFVSGTGTWSSALGQTFVVEAAVGYAEDYEVLQLFTDGGSITFPVPEPATCTMALAGLACGGVSMWRRRRKRSSPMTADCHPARLIHGRAFVMFALAGTLSWGITEAQAGIVVTAQQSGSNVVATLTGSFNLSIAPSGTTNYLENPSVLGGDNPYPANAFNFSNGFTANGLSWSTSNLSAPFARFGSGTAALTLASSFSVSSANVNVRYLNGNVGDLFLSPAYTGGPLNDSLTFANTTMGTLGLDNYGSYLFTYGTGGTTDTVTVNLIPEPATYAMALAGIAYGGYSMWRRRKRA